MARRPVAVTFPDPEVEEDEDPRDPRLLQQFKRGRRTISGPPPKVKKRELRKVIKLALGVRARMAEMLHVDKSTITRCMQRWPDLFALEKAVMENEHRTEAEFALNLRRKALKEEQPWAIRDSLRDNGHHVGIVRRVEHSGIEGAPIQLAQITLNLTPESLRLLSPNVREKLLDGDPAVIDAITEASGHSRRGDDSRAASDARRGTTNRH